MYLRMEKGDGGLPSPEHSRCVRLFEERGETVRIISAEITQDGDLVVAGYDTGKDPRSWFGRDDYEFQATVRAGDKDCLLLALIRKCFAGSPSAVDRFRAFAADEKIPVSFMTW